VADEIELRTPAAGAADGSARERLARAARRGSLDRVRHGFYAEPEEWRAASPDARHLARIRAADAAARGRPVFGGESAALLHGIPLLGGPPIRPVVIVPPGGARSTAPVRRMQRALTRGEITTVAGVVVTTPARTAVDLAFAGPPLRATIAVSHVRRHCGVSLAALSALAAARGAVPGARRAMAALRASTGLADSPLETLVLSRLRDLGFAEPVQQFPVSTIEGEFRVDFAWDDGRLVLEADGRMKYLDEDALWAEKRREDAIRERCAAFARASWDDAWAGSELARKLERLGVPRVRRPRPLTR